MKKFHLTTLIISGILLGFVLGCVEKSSLDESIGYKSVNSL